MLGFTGTKARDKVYAAEGHNTVPPRKKARASAPTISCTARTLSPSHCAIILIPIQLTTNIYSNKCSSCSVFYHIGKSYPQFGRI